MIESFLENDIDKALVKLKAEILRRTAEKGTAAFFDNHHGLGVITEEFWELVEAVKSNAHYKVRRESLDVAVAALWMFMTADVPWKH